MLTREEAARRFAERAEDRYYTPNLREMYRMAAEALSESKTIRCRICKYGHDVGEECCCSCSGTIGNIGEKIRAARRDAGMTQRELSEKTGIAEPTIRKYESGKLNPKRETVQKFAAALSVPACILYGGTAERKMEVEE